MTDTNDMRRDFEACCRVKGGINTSRDSTPPANGGSGEYLYACTNQAWWAWQAATERATALERERCAAVCDALVDVATAKKAFKNVQKTRGKGGFVENSALKFDLTVGHCNRMIEKCAAAIRQGGAA